VTKAERKEALRIWHNSLAGWLKERDDKLKEIRARYAEDIRLHRREISRLSTIRRK